MGERLNFGKILHLGIVVPDLEKAVDIYENRLGIGPWEVLGDNKFFDNMIVNGGHGLAIATAMFRKDGYEIELIQPIGPGVYNDWLRERGPGLHHIKFETDSSFESIVDTAKEISGRPPYLHVA